MKLTEMVGPPGRVEFQAAYMVNGYLTANPKLHVVVFDDLCRADGWYKDHPNKDRIVVFSWVGRKRLDDKGLTEYWKLESLPEFGGNWLFVFNQIEESFYQSLTNHLPGNAEVVRVTYANTTGESKWLKKLAEQRAVSTEHDKDAA